MQCPLQRLSPWPVIKFTGYGPGCRPAPAPERAIRTHQRRSPVNSARPEIPGRRGRSPLCPRSRPGRAEVAPERPHGCGDRTGGAQRVFFKCFLKAVGTGRNPDSPATPGAVPLTGTRTEEFTGWRRPAEEVRAPFGPAAAPVGAVNAVSCIVPSLRRQRIRRRCGRFMRRREQRCWNGAAGGCSRCDGLGRGYNDLYLRDGGRWWLRKSIR